MNNLRKTIVLLFIGVMVISAVLVPFTPIAKVDSQVAQAPINNKELFEQKWAKILNDGFKTERMDSVLASYMDRHHKRW
jgi:hypothetical protein